MISVKTFSPEIKTMTSSIINNIYNFGILNLSKVKAKYEKVKISVPGELRLGQVQIWIRITTKSSALTSDVGLESEPIEDYKTCIFNPILHSQNKSLYF